MGKNHYYANLERYAEVTRTRNQRRKTANKSKIAQYLETHPCVDCGESDPVVLHFDHVRGEKIENVSNMARKNIWSKVEKEIEKCEIRCANCHMRKTAKQFKWNSNG